MALKKGNEVATIDVAMVTLKTLGASVRELALDTSNKVEVTPSTETTDAVKNIVKGKLIAQKPATTTLTGNAITLTDNVFNAELVQILQGGEIKYWADSAHSTMGDTDLGYGVARYTPPLVGSDDKGEIFELCLYSAIYNAAGVITYMSTLLIMKLKVLPQLRQSPAERYQSSRIPNTAPLKNFL